MRVDFYQLSETAVEAALPALAAKMREAGARVLVVSDDERQRQRISDALWAPRGTFLAHGAAGEPEEARQPILLGESLTGANGASYLALADGKWRDGAEAFERVFLLFDGATIDDARAVWRRLDHLGEGQRNYWQQSGGRWEKKA